MSELMVFQNQDFGQMRTTWIENAPWFVGKDVATALAYANTRDALKNHVDSEDKRESPFATPGGTQKMTVINESGLYSLIFSSKLPDAKKFKRWVTSEVLPAIRKNGYYALPLHDPVQQTEQQPALTGLTPGDYIRAASIVAACKTERLPFAMALLEKAGIPRTDLAVVKEQRIKLHTPVARDHEIGRVLNIAHNCYGVTMTGLERVTGIWAAEILRIMRNESYPVLWKSEKLKEGLKQMCPTLWQAYEDRTLDLDCEEAQYQRKH